MANFSSAFKLTTVSASFDATILEQAVHGRTDLFRMAVSADYGVELPSKKSAFIGYYADMVKAWNDKSAHDLIVKGWRLRVSLWSAFASVVDALNGSPELNHTKEWEKAFKPVAKPAPAPASEAPAPLPQLRLTLEQVCNYLTECTREEEQVIRRMLWEMNESRKTLGERQVGMARI